MIEKISDESKKNILARISATPEDYAKKYQGMLKKESFNVCYNAPCLARILGSSSLKKSVCRLCVGGKLFHAGGRFQGIRDLLDKPWN